MELIKNAHVLYRDNGPLTRPQLCLNSDFFPRNKIFPKISVLLSNVLLWNMRISHWALPFLFSPLLLLIAFVVHIVSASFKKVGVDYVFSPKMEP